MFERLQEETALSVPEFGMFELVSHSEPLKNLEKTSARSNHIWLEAKMCSPYVSKMMCTFFRI